MTNKKQFSELTPQGQKARLAKYAKERAERGTEETLARLVRPATFKEVKGGNEIAIYRFAAYNEETEETEFFTASAFVQKGKDSLRNFYAGLQKGQLVAVEYKQNGDYKNIYNLMDRSYADKRKQKAEAPVEQELEA